MANTTVYGLGETIATGDHIVLPQDDDAVTPTLGFGDGSYGFYSSADKRVDYGAGGFLRAAITDTFVKAANDGGLANNGATATVPSICPKVEGDVDSGIGWAGADAPNIIAGSIEAVRYTEVSNEILQSVQAGVGLTAHTDSNQGSGPIISTYNVYDIVGTAGDAATLPGTFPVGTLVYVKNGAAANSMDIFPTLGDDAGAGTDTVVAIAAGDFLVFLGTTANATWEQIMGGTA